MSSRVLVVESSPTQKHAFKAAAKEYSWEIIACSDHSDACELLTADNEDTFDAVVWGWVRNDNDVISVLELASNPGDGSRVPIVITSNDPDKGLKDFLKSNPMCMHHKRSEIDKVVKSVDQMLKASTNEVFPLSLSRKLAETAPFFLCLESSDGEFAEIDDYFGLATQSGAVVKKQVYNEDFEVLDDQIPDVIVMSFAGSEKFVEQVATIQDVFGYVPMVLICRDDVTPDLTDYFNFGLFLPIAEDASIEDYAEMTTQLSKVIELQRYIDGEKHRYEAILSSIGDGVYGVDQYGRVTFINPAAKKLLGLSQDIEFLGKKASEIFHGLAKKNDVTDKLEMAYLEGWVLRNLETSFRHSSGREMEIECTVYPLRYGSERQGSVVAFHDVTQRKSLEKKLVWQANHDPLTHLYNRRYFEFVLERESARLKSASKGSESALIYIDLSRFKYLNDVAGHDAGDKLLIDVSQKLKANVRSTDSLARLAGDEFTVLVKNVDPPRAVEIAELLRESIRECTFVNEDISFKLGCSIGVCMIGSNGVSGKEGLVNADIACNTAKRRGRNEVHLYDNKLDMGKQDMSEVIGWSTRLNEALINDRFQLMFQPILPLKEIDFNMLPEQQEQLWTVMSHVPEYYEVLLRMKGDDDELISPQAFLPIAERFNLIQAIDLWVINHALKRLSILLKEEDRNVTFSVNISGTTLNDVSTHPKIAKMLEDYKIRAGCVIFEITETSAIDKLDESLDFINDMRSKGWRFALDDFGTGFSSFSQMKDLPVDAVKIDGQFVSDMVHDPVDRAIVTAINEIAHSLGMETIAEYVEDVETLRLLDVINIDYAQGFYISRPLSNVERRADTATLMLKVVEPLMLQ